ncbi:hypothetical protein ACFL39_01870 [Gemmatimonadota bacterium]
MRLHYSLPLIILLLLVGCSKTDRGTEIPEGHLELVWAVQPEGATGEELEEPWFTNIVFAAVSENDVFVADLRRGHVLQLNNAGQFVRVIGRRGSGPGEFETGPRRVSISTGGLLICQDSFFDFNTYTPDGQFIENTTATHPSSEMRIESPYALDDSTIVWNVGMRATLEPGIEGYLAFPPLLAVRNGESIPLGTRHLTEIELTTMKSLINRNQGDERIQCSNFTSGMAVRGYNEDEILHINYGNPYEVHRFHLRKSPTFFTYYERETDKWIEEVQMPTDEAREMGWMYKFRYRGPNHSPLEGIFNMYCFTHSLRGIAVRGDSLAVFVEIITAEFQPNDMEKGIEQLLYIIDLEQEEAVMRVMIDTPMPQLQLHGALDDGTLIFSTNEPVPGILAYRIVPN